MYLPLASSIEFVEYIADQLATLGDIQYKKMFGEYGLYHDEKFFACICDNQLFVKITDEGYSVLKNPETAPPYNGAKPYFLIADIDNKELLQALTIATCNALPVPKPRKK